MVHVVEERSSAVRGAAGRPVLVPPALPVGPVGHRIAAPGRSTQVVRRELVRTVTAEIPQQRDGGDRAARREALLHALEMSRRRRRTVRR